LEAILKDVFTYHLVVAIAIVLAFLFLSGFVKRVLNWTAKKLLTLTETQLDDLILDVVRKNTRALMIVVGLHIALREIRKGIVGQDATADQIFGYTDAILYVAIVVVVLKIVLGILRVAIHWYLDQVSTEDESHLKATLAPLTGKIVNIIVGMVAIIIVLDHFGINIGSLLVSLGVGSLAVALAAQDTLANMISGFVILVDRPFRVGDRIELPTGQIGDVHQIGLRSTKIINYDNNVIIMPNAELVKSRIVNYSYPNDQMRVLLRLDLAHGTDTERVRQLLLQLAHDHVGILRDPEPRVFVMALTDSSVQCALICRCGDYRMQLEIETDIREKAHRMLTAEGIEFGVQQRFVRIKQETK
jgi:small-conductance mechanosensitive channel